MINPNNSERSAWKLCWEKIKKKKRQAKDSGLLPQRNSASLGSSRLQWVEVAELLPSLHLVTVGVESFPMVPWLQQWAHV